MHVASPGQPMFSTLAVLLLGVGLFTFCTMTSGSPAGPDLIVTRIVQQVCSSSFAGVLFDGYVATLNNFYESGLHGQHVPLLSFTASGIMIGHSPYWTELPTCCEEIEVLFSASRDFGSVTFSKLGIYTHWTPEQVQARLFELLQEARKELDSLEEKANNDQTEAQCRYARTLAKCNVAAAWLVSNVFGVQVDLRKVLNTVNQVLRKAAELMAPEESYPWLIAYTKRMEKAGLSPRDHFSEVNREELLFLLEKSTADYLKSLPSPYNHGYTVIKMVNAAKKHPEWTLFEKAKLLGSHSGMSTVNPYTHARHYPDLDWFNAYFGFKVLEGDLPRESLTFSSLLSPYYGLTAFTDSTRDWMIPVNGHFCHKVHWQFHDLFHRMYKHSDIVLFYGSMPEPETSRMRHEQLIAKADVCKAMERSSKHSIMNRLTTSTTITFYATSFDIHSRVSSAKLLPRIFNSTVAVNNEDFPKVMVDYYTIALYLLKRGRNREERLVGEFVYSKTNALLSSLRPFMPQIVPQVFWYFDHVFHAMTVLDEAQSWKLTGVNSLF